MAACSPFGPDFENAWLAFGFTRVLMPACVLHLPLVVLLLSDMTAASVVKFRRWPAGSDGIETPIGSMPCEAAARAEEATSSSAHVWHYLPGRRLRGLPQGEQAIPCTGSPAERCVRPTQNRR